MTKLLPTFSKVLAFGRSRIDGNLDRKLFTFLAEVKPLVKFEENAKELAMETTPIICA